MFQLNDPMVVHTLYFFAFLVSAIVALLVYKRRWEKKHRVKKEERNGFF